MEVICNCGEAAEYEHAEAAIRAGWIRVHLEGHEGGQWFCPSTPGATVITSANVLEAEQHGRRVIVEGRIRE